MEETEENFKETMKEWVQLNDQLSKSKKHITLLNKRKKELSVHLKDYMKRFSIDVCKIGEKKGKVKLAITKRTAPVNRAHIQKCLTEYLKDEAKAIECTDYIFKNREIIEDSSLKRTHNRTKPDEEEEEESE